MEFVKGYIKDIPLQDETVDVVTSNCVINLSESKEVALGEAYRVLKKGGEACYSGFGSIKRGITGEAAQHSLSSFVSSSAARLTE